MSKLGENFEIPSESVPDAFGVNNDRSEYLDNLLRSACKNAVKRHSMTEDTTLDHVLSDIMREVDTQTTLTAGEKDMMMLQLGANLGSIRNAIAEIRGLREVRKQIENLSDDEKARLEEEAERMRILGGRLVKTIANVLNDDPSDHDFSDN
jgi:hypothetical protein